jgi:hypothetical protein
MNTDDKPTTKLGPSSPLPEPGTVSSRFVAIADYFLAMQKATYKTKRTWLYKREREAIELWAQDTDMPLDVIRKGIFQGFKEALSKGKFVSSVIWCLPHVALAIRDWEQSIEGSLLWAERRNKECG